MGRDAAGRRASSGRATASLITHGGVVWSSANFIDQVASDLREHRHIRIGNGTAGAGDVPVVA